MPVVRVISHLFIIQHNPADLMLTSIVEIYQKALDHSALAMGTISK